MNASAPPDRATAFGLLAAGDGTRFGGDKLLADLCGKPLWRWAAGSAEDAGFVSRFIVTNHKDIAEQARASGWHVEHNAEADEGIAASIRVAARASCAAGRLVLALADMPLVEAAHLRALAHAGPVAFTRYTSGRMGVPAGFSHEQIARLATLEGDRGAGSLDWPGALVLEPDTPDSLIDVDTPADLARVRAITIKRAQAGLR